MTGVKAGDVFVSRLGTGLKVSVVKVDPGTIIVTVERKLIDRKSGELTVQKNERRIAEDDWSRFIKAYEQVSAP